MTKVIKEVIWLKDITHELGLYSGHITMYCDNQSIIHLAKIHVYHERSRYIEVRHHFVRDVISTGKIILENVPTEDNPLDILTKAQPIVKFRHYLNLINMDNCWLEEPCNTR